MYGQERLGGLLCESRDLPAGEIADAILADVTRFQGTHDRFDDETIIVLRVREPESPQQNTKDPS
jgi:sigma-B regulation protein RsbU (phosphoserine phosphatase)